MNHLTREQAATLVRIIKQGSDEDGIRIFRSIAATIQKSWNFAGWNYKRKRHA